LGRNRSECKFRNRYRFYALIAGALLLPALTVLLGAAHAGKYPNPGQSAPGGPTPIDFNRDVAPVLQASCVKCHGSLMTQAGLRLDSEAGVLKGGVSGRAIVPGHSDDSLLVKRLLGALGSPRMPMGGDPLPSQEINVIREWIDHGNFSVQASGAPEVEPPVASHPQVAASTASSPVFAREIRPILAGRCYGCHGPNVQQNGLRLDSLQALLKGSDNGPIVVPGQADQSRLIRRLTALERPQMPYGGPPLSDEEIQQIRAWINAGAPGPDSAEPVAAVHPLKHWAYVKPVRPALPQVKNAAWCRNPIDYFVLARLEKEGLAPSPEADKATLIRRVYLDLIGLPPTPQAVDAFLADKRPDAYERVVDQLLASPRYGERWASRWLDLARYADSNGYEKDDRRTAWEFRDWVIRALNENMPFSEFTIEQIAGDMLPNATTDQLIASGFNRNTLLNQEGGVDPYEYYWYEQVDRVNTTASVWLGSTLGCAECHNHKFDPFTQKDYYRFLAFYDDSMYQIAGPTDERWAKEPDIELPSPEQAKDSKELRAQIAKLQSLLDTSTPELEAAQAKWEAGLKNGEADWSVLAPAHATSAGGATLKVLADQSILASGKNPYADAYTMEAKTEAQNITGVRLTALTDASLPHGGPGRDSEGNFFLSGFEVEAAPAGNPSQKVKITFKDAVANESQGGYAAKNLVSKDPGVRGWAIDASPSPVPLRRQLVMVPDKPFGFAGGTVLTIELKHEMRHTNRNLGHFRLSVTSMADPAAITQLPARLWPMLDTPEDKRTPEEKQKLAAVFRSVTPLLQPTRDQMAKLQKSVDQLGIPTAMVMEEKPGFLRPATYIRERGSFLSKGEKVYAGVPAILNPLPPDQMPNRLGLAYWLVSDDNPLTARVTVNRYWEAFFGHGIVETTEDFGTQGDPPTHPELLDWLATEFMRKGWDMKAIKREIVTSATYRQSSRVTPELLARDPYNKLLARGPRFRVEAETVHDVALSASGLLSSKMYGPPVFPYQPDGIWDVPYNEDSYKWVMSQGEDRYRRAVYTFMRRSAPYPSLITFDAPSREFCTVRRVRTNTPLQALTMLNDPLFVDAARALALRIMKEGGEDVSGRVTYGFRLVAARQPSPPELDRIMTFYNQELEHYRSDTKAAGELIQVKENPPPDVSERAAWTMVANVLLNLDETITKE